MSQRPGRCVGSLNRTEIWKTGSLPELGLLALPLGFIPVLIMFWRSKRFWPMSVDFTYLWVSGEVWARGLSPYGPAFTESAHRHHVDLPYVYPPNWYPVSRLLALLDPGAANLIWFVASIGFIILGSWLVAASLLRFERWFSPLACWFIPAIAEPFRTMILGCQIAGFILATKAAATNAHLGQTGALVFLGSALVIYGVVRSGRIMIAAGSGLPKVSQRYPLRMMAARW